MNTHAIKSRNIQAVVDGRSKELIERLQNHPNIIAESACVGDCLARGYAPKGYGLADFSILIHNGWFHLFHIPRVPGNSCIHPANEHWIGHAVSKDLDSWVTCNPALCIEPANYFESAHVWAPFVFDTGEDTYMFYTGLSQEPSQVLCVAHAEDPDLTIWKRNVSNPIVPIEGFDWHWLNSKGHVRHARDPHVVKTGEGYLLAYTAMHRDGCPAVGGLFSSDLQKWEDIGPILYRPMQPAPWLPESVTIQPLGGGRWVLMPSQSPGIEYYISNDPYCWHDATASSIEYADGAEEQPMALEIISTEHADMWLVCFFERGNNRFFVGTLETGRHPWRLKRIRRKDDLQPWSAIIT